MAQWGPSTYYAITGAIATYLTPHQVQQRVRECRGERDIAALFCDAHTRSEVAKDIKFIFHDKGIYVASTGGSLSPYNCVLAHAGLIPLENDPALRFVLRHEIGHLKHSDGIKRHFAAFMVSTVAAAALPSLEALFPSVPSFVWYMVPQQAGMSAYWVTTRFTELHADMFAIDGATNEELVAAAKFTRAEMAIFQEMHERYPQIFTKEGALTFSAQIKAGGDSQHHSGQERLAMIELAIRAKGINESQYSAGRTVEQYKFILNPVFTALFEGSAAS